MLLWHRPCRKHLVFTYGKYIQRLRELSSQQHLNHRPEELHSAYDHGGLQHARHEPDAVREAVAHQAVGGGEDLGGEISSILIGPASTLLRSHWSRSAEW